jgi:hypothetical protein
MELTRYWRAQHDGRNIEVQWSGVRFRGGWTLRLLINGELRAERKVPRFAENFEVRDGAITVTFWGKGFRHRCTISAGGKVLTDRTQPWNPLAFTIIFGPVSVVLIVFVLVPFVISFFVHAR